MSIDYVLSPVAHDDFLTQYWEVQPLHVSRSDSSHFEKLLSEAKLVGLIQEGEAVFPDVQAINAKKAVPVADYTLEGKSVCSRKMMECYAEGATIMVSEVHKKFPALQQLCARFSKDMQIRCQANAYLSPAGNQGFHSHYDTHDVFVLQVAGRKKFRFYASEIELPFPEDTYTPDNNTSGEMVDEVELSAGDTLYIPRGIVHDAIADEGEPSLHITLGAFPFVLRDLMQEMVQVAAENNTEWRSSVDLVSQAHDSAELYRRAGSIFSDAVYFEALSRLADEVVLEQPTEVLSVPAFSIDSRLLVEHSSLHGVECRDGRLKLRLPGKIMSFEEPLATAVDALVRAESMKVGDIPALLDDQKLALCQQLAEAGAITFGNDA